MLKSRLIVAASAVALSLAALSAPAFAATPAKHKPPIHHVMVKKYHYVSGRIVAIDKAADMITLSNGKTYRVSAKVIGKYKVGQHVRLRIV